MMNNSENPFGFIKPLVFLPEMMTSTTAADGDPPAWAGAAAQPGDVVSVASTQVCYECLVANTGAAPDQNVLGLAPKWAVSRSRAVAWNPNEYVRKGARRRLDSTHRVYECQADHQGTAGATATVTVSVASPCFVSWPGHNQPAGTEVKLSTTGTLPSGVSEGITYYVTAPTGAGFNLAATRNGAAVATTGTQSGTHTATVASTSPDVSVAKFGGKWTDLGATNAWAAFDEKWGTQSVARNSLTIVLTPGEVVDSLGLLNLIGNEISVTCTVDGSVIYTKSMSLQTDVGVYDLKTYFLAPIVAQDDVVLTDLLPYYQQQISITITGPGRVAIGNISLGRYIRVGVLEYSAKAGIRSFSKKKVDEDFGDVYITPRGYAKRFGGTIVIDTAFADQCAAILAQVRDTACVWIGAGNMFSCLIAWGFFLDFEVDIRYRLISYCTMTIEGLV